MRSSNNAAKLILRLGFGGMMLVHGIPKFMKLINGTYEKFPDPLQIGALGSLSLTVFSECICAVLIIIGYKTKWAAIPLAITMLVAAFIVHGSDPFASKEKALLYAVGYIVIAMVGAGKYSIDKR